MQNKNVSALDGVLNGIWRTLSSIANTTPYSVMPTPVLCLCKRCLIKINHHHLQIHKMHSKLSQKLKDQFCQLLANKNNYNK